MYKRIDVLRNRGRTHSKRLQKYLKKKNFCFQFINLYQKILRLRISIFLKTINIYLLYHPTILIRTILSYCIKSVLYFVKNPQQIIIKTLRF